METVGHRVDCERMAPPDAWSCQRGLNGALCPTPTGNVRLVTNPSSLQQEAPASSGHCGHVDV